MCDRAVRCTIRIKTIYVVALARREHVAHVAATKPTEAAEGPREGSSGARARPTQPRWPRLIGIGSRRCVGQAAAVTES